MVTGDTEGRAETPGARAEGSGRYPREQAVGVSNTTVKTDHSLEEKMDKLMDAVVGRENMRQAYSRVMRNKGAAGVDGMLVADLKANQQAIEIAKIFPDCERIILITGAEKTPPVQFPRLQRFCTRHRASALSYWLFFRGQFRESGDEIRPATVSV